MQKVADTVDDIEEAEINLKRVSFLVPCAGNSLASLGMQTVGRIIKITGELGNVANEIYGLYTNLNQPSSKCLGCS
jgi:hypothetical protein